MEASRIFLSIIFISLFRISPGQEVAEFNLMNISGEKISLASFTQSKAVVIIFTGNHCVYSKKYEDRIIGLEAKYKSKGIQFILINSNSPELSEDDQIEVMKARAEEKGFSFPYLQDPDQAVAKNFGAKKIPEAFLIAAAAGKWKIHYSGLIDDNPLIADAVSENYLAKAIDNFLASGAPGIQSTISTGCGIKGLE